MSEFRQYGVGDVFGTDGYPVEWHTLKHLVREEGEYRCARCRHPYHKGDGEWSACDGECRHGKRDTVRDGARVLAHWRILTVHHLDMNKANCRWWNLVPLCQRCHLNVQLRVVMDREYDKPHSDWFKPYAAGFYAWKYLGEDLSRDDVERRMDELLALELRQERLFS